MSRAFTGYIDENSCIGDTLGTAPVITPTGTINGNFYNLDTGLSAISAENIIFKNSYNTLIQTISGLAAPGTNYNSLSTTFLSLSTLIIP